MDHFQSVRITSDRMTTRRVQYGDVRHALVNALHGRPADDGRWKVEGPYLDGDSLSVVLLVEDGLIVVTVF